MGNIFTGNKMPKRKFDLHQSKFDLYGGRRKSRRTSGTQLEFESVTSMLLNAGMPREDATATAKTCIHRARCVRGGAVPTGIIGVLFKALKNLMLVAPQMLFPLSYLNRPDVSPLQGGWVVTSIGGGYVTAEKSNTTIKIPFGGGAGAIESAPDGVSPSLWQRTWNAMGNFKAAASSAFTRAWNWVAHSYLVILSKCVMQRICLLAVQLHKNVNGKMSALLKLLKEWVYKTINYYAGFPDQAENFWSANKLCNLTAGFAAASFVGRVDFRKIYVANGVHAAAQAGLGSLGIGLSAGGFMLQTITVTILYALMSTGVNVVKYICGSADMDTVFKLTNKIDESWARALTGASNTTDLKKLASMEKERSAALQRLEDYAVALDNELWVRSKQYTNGRLDSWYDCYRSGYDHIRRLPIKALGFTDEDANLLIKRDRVRQTRSRLAALGRHKKQVTGGELPTIDEMSTWTRKQLQTAAKARGIRANMKSEDLRRALATNSSKKEDNSKTKENTRQIKATRKKHTRMRDLRAVAQLYRVPEDKSSQKMKDDAKVKTKTKFFEAVQTAIHELNANLDLKKRSNVILAAAEKHGELIDKSTRHGIHIDPVDHTMTYSRWLDSQRTIKQIAVETLGLRSEALLTDYGEHGVVTMAKLVEETNGVIPEQVKPTKKANGESKKVISKVSGYFGSGLTKCVVGLSVASLCVLGVSFAGLGSDYIDYAKEKLGISRIKAALEALVFAKAEDIDPEDLETLTLMSMSPENLKAYGDQAVLQGMLTQLKNGDFNTEELLQIMDGLAEYTEKVACRENAFACQTTADAVQAGFDAVGWVAKASIASSAVGAVNTIVGAVTGPGAAASGATAASSATAAVNTIASAATGSGAAGSGAAGLGAAAKLATTAGVGLASAGAGWLSQKALKSGLGAVSDKVAGNAGAAIIVAPFVGITAFLAAPAIGVGAAAATGVGAIAMAASSVLDKDIVLAGGDVDAQMIQARILCTQIRRARRVAAYVLARTSNGQK